MSHYQPLQRRIVTLPFLLLGVLAVVGLYYLAERFVNGMGAVTNLNGGFPWGIWVVYDIVVGTALACGGYALAVTVYIFNKGQYHPLIRPALLASLLLRAPMKVDIVRDRASLARLVEDGWIENVYRLQIMNATERTQRYRIGATGFDGLVVEPAGEVALGPAEARWVPVAVRVPPEVAQGKAPGAHPLIVQVERLPETAGERSVAVDEETTFVLPR